MAHSMTAFSVAQGDVDGLIFCWELKTVNHRYLDASFRVPELFRFLEPKLRDVIRGRLHRGKLECQLKIIEMPHDESMVVIDEKRVKMLLSFGEMLARKYALANDLSVSQLMHWPDVVRAAKSDVTVFESSLMDTFEQAVDKLLQARQSEGDVLGDFIKTRLHVLAEETTQAQVEVDLALKKARKKLLGRIEALDLSVEGARIEQEIALMLTRLDVSEELDRLKVHMDEVSQVLVCEDGPIGKRLDFFMQELNREANTLSSKSDSVALTQHAVQMKVLIEQMREQIQNIE